MTIPLRGMNGHRGWGKRLARIKYEHLTLLSRKPLYRTKEILATGGAFAAKIEDGSTVLWGALG